MSDHGFLPSQIYIPELYRRYHVALILADADVESVTFPTEDTVGSFNPGKHFILPQEDPLERNKKTIKNTTMALGK